MSYSIDMGPDGPSTGATIETVEVDLDLTYSEMELVIDFLDNVEQETEISQDQFHDVVDVFIKGVEHPAARADAIGTLMNNQGADVLADVFDQTWIPELDAELKDELVEISQITDEREQIEKMAELVSQEIRKEQGEIPENPWHGQKPITPEADDRTIRNRRIHSFNETALATEQGYDKGELFDNPELSRSLSEGNREAIIQVIEWTDDPIVGDKALELLYDQGDDVMPVLEEFMEGHDRIQELKRWIQTGVKPDFSSSRLAQIASDRDTDSLVDLIKQTPNRSDLVEQVSLQGEDMVDVLVDLLDHEDSEVTAFAMDSLYELGPEAEEELRLAEVRGSEAVQERAKQLLRAQYSGDTDWQDVVLPDDRNPFKISSDELGRNGGASNNGGYGTPTQFTLDVDKFANSLSNNETRMEALSACVQLGAQQAMPILCDALIETRRKQKRNHGRYL